MKFNPLLLVRDYSGGLNLFQRPNKIAENQLQELIGFDFDANTLRRAKGYQQYGTEEESADIGKTIYKHSILAGEKLLIKTIGQKIKFYDQVSDSWLPATTATFTANLWWSFATFNGYLYGNNGTDNWIFWNAATKTTITNALTSADTEIDLPTGKGALYPSSGNVMIGSEQITYTGKTGDQLTGATIAGNHAAGSTVVLELNSTTYSSLQKADEIAFFKNRMYLIDTETPTIVRHSKLADNTNPETDLVNFTITGSGSGDAGFGIAPDKIVSIKPIVNGNQSSVLAAFCEDGTVYAFVVSDSGSTTTNSFVQLRTMNAYPQAPSLVADVDNDVMFVDQNSHVRTLSYGDVNTPLQIATISDLIKPQLESMDFSDGSMVQYKRKKYVIGKTSRANYNDLTFFHDSLYSAWGAYNHWDAVDLTVSANELFALSNITGKVWKMETGYDADGGNYTSTAKTKEFDFNAPLIYKSATKVRLSGFISISAEVYLDFFFDGSPNPRTFLLSGNNTEILGSEEAVSIGEVVFGEGVFSGELPEGEDLREFVAQLNFNTQQPFFRLAMRIRINGKNIDFEVNDMLIWAKLHNENLWKKQAIITQS